MIRKHFFRYIGAGIIVLWLVMIGILIKKESFNKDIQHINIPLDKAVGLKRSQREWMEVYLNGEKVGYSVNQVNPLKDGIAIEEEIFLRLNVMGQTSIVRAVTKSVVDHNFLLKNFRFRISSGVVCFDVSGIVEGDRMVLETGEGASRKTEAIKLSCPPVIASAIPLFFKGRPIDVGQSFRFPVFDPSTMAQKELVLKVVARETVEINTEEYSALRLDAEMWGRQLTFWLDENGTVLKEKGFMGFTLVKCSADRAPRGISGSGDVYEMVAIKIKGKLRDADKLTSLRLKVEGLDKTHFDTGILNKGRQKFRDGVIEIVREKALSKGTYSLPYEDISGKMRPYLDPEFNIESDNNVIMERACMIARDIEDPLVAAKRLMEWVYKNLKKMPVITVPSALEVLKTRVGDCNEHAVLLTALLRAIGIPSRLCVGLVYVRGSFFYHAWNECYVGKWISMDATLNQMPVDVTHVKLVQGGLSRQVEIIGLIGKLRIEVIGYN